LFIVSQAGAQALAAEDVPLQEVKPIITELVVVVVILARPQHADQLIGQ
jgi:hypothetical protein